MTETKLPTSKEIVELLLPTAQEIAEARAKYAAWAFRKPVEVKSCS